jgi:RNA polymerase sigma-70 factor (ECF subfamily)
VKRTTTEKNVDSREKQVLPSTNTIPVTFGGACAMSEDDSFQDLIRRVRAGEGKAASELVRRYEPTIRREVRLRLRDPRLRRMFDSMDVCQSVLGSFFIRAAAGQYELNSPQHLQRLLVTMARNKVVKQVHRQRAARRDHRRTAADPVQVIDLAAPDASPSRYVAARDLLREAQERLSAEERRLAELRSQGMEWADIARELGGTAGGRRKQLDRALDRVARELGLEEEDGE